MRYNVRPRPIATTRKMALATFTSIQKGSGSLAILLMFLLAAMTNAHATTTLTPATVTASPASPTAGASVTLTATLSTWVSAAGGTITFETSTSSTGTYGTTLVTCGSSGSATVTVIGTSTTCQTSALPVGTTYVKAVYATTATGYAGGTSATAASVAVTATPTTTTLTTSTTSTALGNPVTLTAAVSPSAATGTVTFKSAVTTVGTLGTCSITTGGTCSLTVATTGWTVSTTANSLTAVYAATGNYATSTSPAKIVIIDAAGTATTTGVVTLGTASPIVYGTSETLNATVSAGTGTVTFLDNGTTSLGTGTISSGTVSLILPTLAPGTHSITAAYGGDTTHDASASASATALTVTSATTTTLTAAATGTYGTAYSLMANVVPTAGPGTTSGGLVTFSNGSVTLGSCTLNSVGTCSTSTTALPPGSYTVTASYPGATSGGVTYNPSSAGTPITAAAATLAASLSVTNAQGAAFTTAVAQGTSVLLTANVAPALVASGTVNFTVGGTSIAGCSAVNLVSGAATCLTASLPSGSDSLSAIFTQTANTPDFVSPTGTGNASLTMFAAPALVVSSAPYYYGATVTLNVSGFPVAASGATVSFLDGSTSLGSCSLNSGGTCGTALSLSTLTVTNHSITGSFAGNGSFPAVSTASQNVNVVANPTTATVASSATYVATSNPSPFTLTATVTTSDGITVPSGHVTFYDSNVSLGTGTVSAGTATLTVSAANSNTLTTPGTHYLIASYGGDYSALGVATFGPSLSKSAKVVVESVQTISGWYSRSTVYGTPITLSATSSSAADPNGMPSGSITFSVTGTTGNITAASLNGNTLTPNGVGTITITAALAANSNYAAATSVSKTFTVYPKPLTITASSPSATPSDPNYASSPLTYGGAVPTISPSYSGGFVGTDTAASLGSVTCATNYAALSTNHPGPYSTYCYGATNPNYDITLVGGSFNTRQGDADACHPADRSHCDHLCPIVKLPADRRYCDRSLWQHDYRLLQLDQPRRLPACGLFDPERNLQAYRFDGLQHGCDLNKH